MDTTVILAQPRVSRLRAAVVYALSGGRVAAGKIDVIVWAGLSRRPPQNAKSLRPRQLKRRSKKDLRPRGRFWAQGPQVVPSHLGNPIAENLDPRHGDSDIAPVLRQSFIFLAMFETFVDFEGQYWPCLRLLSLYFR